MGVVLRRVSEWKESKPAGVKDAPNKSNTSPMGRQMEGIYEMGQSASLVHCVQHPSPFLPGLNDRAGIDFSSGGHDFTL
jgi:hypothetical protein